MSAHHESGEESRSSGGIFLLPLFRFFAGI